jgi:hypothetical protein
MRDPPGLRRWFLGHRPGHADPRGECWGHQGICQLRPRSDAMKNAQVAVPAGLEPATFAFEARCSIR